jgi:peptide/nickel transport system substrate-binding protein
LATACGGGAAPAQKAPESKPATPAATAKPISPQAPAAAPSPSPGASPAPASKPAAAAPAPTGKRGGTLTFARGVDITTFSPTNLNVTTSPFQRALYNTLVHYDLNLNVVPELAESFQVAPDGKSITLKLRRDVKFHSGRGFTADDVEFSVKWFADPKNSSAVRQMAAEVKQVDKPDPYTVTLRFEQLNVSLFDLLDVMFIVDQSMLDKLPTMDGGSGPFRVAEFRPNEFTKMVPFDGYWNKGQPLLNEYILKPVPDAQAMAIQLETGAADVIWLPGFPDVVRLAKDSKFQTYAGAPGAVFWDIAVNTTSEHLTDKRVRQAISYVLDRERFCRTAMAGLVEATNIPWPKTSWAYHAEFEGRHKRDVDKAKQLMAAAGKQAGFTVSILTSSKRAPGQSELTQILQANLEEIGIKSKIEDVEFAVYEKRNRLSDWDLMVHSYGRANKDPQTLFTGAIAWYARGQSWTKYNGEEYGKLIDQAGGITDRDQRKAIYKRLTEIILDESFTIVVAEQPRPFVYRNYVKDMRLALDNQPYVGEIWLDK